jgi:RHS repeat-associated protein
MKPKTKILYFLTFLLSISIIAFVSWGEQGAKKGLIKEKSRNYIYKQSIEQTTKEKIGTLCENKFFEKYPKKIIYKSNNTSEGIIGVFEKNKIDNPFDNIFHILIDTIIGTNYNAYLEYELFGLEDFTSVCKSVNNQTSTGGFLIKKSEKWSLQREEINIKHLKIGDNIVRFTVPDGSNYGYKIRNVRIVFKSLLQHKGERYLVINQPNTFTFYKRYGYIQGFINGKGCENAIIKVNNKILSNNEGSFEGIVERNEIDTGRWKAMVTAEFKDGYRLQTEVFYQKYEDFDYTFNLENNIRKSFFIAHPNEVIDFYHDGVKLNGETSSIESETELSATSLRSVDMPPMGAGMVNVTGINSGYRLLPHGTEFQKEIKISLKYDTLLLPKGYKATDIYTFYFDEKQNNWIKLQRDTVDLANNFIISKTNHFSDYINAIIKSPEMPETQAFTPTSLKDIQAANPLAGLNLISPPTANNMGTANISFPIEIPQGRQGMQPSLVLQYNSSSGNGWLGMGWNLPIPAITVETQWGVPLYSNVYETESYLISGEQIAPSNPDGTQKPLVNKAKFELRDTNYYRNFAYVIEGAFNKIIRHGTNPKNYWWTVTDKNGTKYYYGKYPFASNISPKAVLADDNGNIAYWALTTIQDVYGNSVNYEYDTVQHTGLINGTIKCRQIYIKKIQYTNYQNTINGLYSVEFERKNNNGNLRDDVQINGRYGFKEVTNDLLHSITIKYQSDTIRRYIFGYRDGLFNKTILCSVFELTGDYDNINEDDNSICELVRTPKETSKGEKIHKFDYYINEPQSFFSSQELKINSLNYQEESSLLGYTSNVNFNPGGGLGVGIGPKNDKTFSFGGNYNYSYSFSNGKVILIDIDGDNLPDKVYKDNDVIKYRKLVKLNNGYKFSDTPLSIFNGDFLFEETKSDTWGGEGHVGISEASANIGGEQSNSGSYTTHYLADVNGDGLVDIINNGIVYFNKLNQYGKPNFIKYLTDTVYIGENSCDYIIHSGEINDTLLLDDDKVHVKKTYHESVRMWVAPYDGIVTINAPIQLIEDTSFYRKQSKYVDGIRYLIQRSSTLLLSDTISKDNYQTKSVLLNNINVNKGDNIYFRLKSIENRNYDEIIWDPEIYYTDTNKDTSIIDADSLKIFYFKASKDFLLNSQALLTMPLKGKIKFFGNIYSQKPLSDTVWFQIYKTVGNTTNLYKEIVFPDNNVFNHLIYDSTTVDTNDVYTFFAKSKSNIDWNSLKYSLTVYYSYADSITIDTTSVFNNISFKPIVHFSMFQKVHINSKKVNLPVASGLIVPVINYNSNYIANNQKLYLTVKKNHDIITSKMLTIQNNKIQGDSTIQFSNGSSTDNYFFDFYTDSNIFASKILTIKVKFNNNEYHAGLHSKIPDTLYKFGHLYRGWGQFCYNENSNILLNENKLHLKNYSIDISSLSSSFDTNSIKNNDSLKSFFHNNNIPDPYYDVFSMMFPDMDSGVWRGYGNLTMIGRNKMNNTRKKVFLQIGEFDYPIPKINGKNAKAPFKLTNIETTSYNGSVGASIDNINGSKSTTETSMIFDFMDLNGDRYPDVVGPTQYQYTFPFGGLGNLANHAYNGNLIHKSTSEAIGTTFGTSYPVAQIIASVNPSRSKKSVISYGSINQSQSVSKDETNYTFMDINGDGLPDKVLEDKKVCMNLGYSFLSPENWEITDIRKGKSKSKGTSVGVNIAETSFSVGVNSNEASNDCEFMYLDVNGDGLEDRVFFTTNNYHRNMNVQLNKGNGYGNSEIWLTDFITPQSLTNTYLSGNLSATLVIPIQLLFIPIKLYINPKFSATKNNTEEKAKLIDINADGYVDYVLQREDNELVVRYSSLGKVNLLKKVTNSTGSSFEIDYCLSDNTQKSPQRSWVMSSLIVKSGHFGDGCDSLLTKFEYKNPTYSRADRISFGFDTVITNVINAMVTNSYTYKTIIERYHNNKFLFKGLKCYEVLLDSLKRKQIETFYTYKHKRISTGEEVPDSMLMCFGDYYPAISKEDKYFYESQPNYRVHTQKQYKHGRWGNVIQYKNLGDVAISDDDLIADIIYDSIINLHIVSLQKKVTVKNFANNVLRHREAYYNSFGKYQQIIINNGANQSIFRYGYDNYGNISSITLPENANNEQRAVYFEYLVFGFYNYQPSKIYDNIGYITQYEYDYRFGKPTKIIDITGNITEYSFDGYGRLVTVRGPYEIDNNIPYAIKFEFWDNNSRIGIIPDTLPWARTKHYDMLNKDNLITTVLLTDGLGRELQIKKKATIFNPIENQESDSLIVSGRVFFDAYGRIVKSYLPITESLSADSIFNYTTSNYPPTFTCYDVLDRATKITTPDSRTSFITYGFGNDYFGKTRFKKVLTDPLNNSIAFYTDYRDKNTTIVDAFGEATRMSYNAMGELTDSYDPEGNLTHFDYDISGKLLQRLHPDAGITRYSYDPAGNIISMKTQNLINQSSEVRYNYFYNQLTEISYPQNPENNVYYKYGSSGSGNQTGRIITQQDASGVQNFYYGKLGELIKNIHTFVMPEGKTYTFETRWNYDTWNRITDISYPDGEKIAYYYNNGGQLRSMQSDVNNYISYIGYDKYEKRLRIDYGNGTYAKYQYNQLNQQLSNLTSFNSLNEQMQNIDYQYDDVNNITSIANNAQTMSNGMGGTYYYNYFYDMNYRLINSSGSFNGSNNFELNMQYSPSGNIIQKAQYAETNINGLPFNINYNRDYSYNITQPHTIEQINNEISFKWDANGNLINYQTQGEFPFLRNHCWDEENRLMAVKDLNYLSHYIYDAGGERVWKITGEVERMQINYKDYIDYVSLNNITLYVNPYFVANDREYTKHYYIEGQRVCSKLGGGLANSLTDFNDQLQPIFKDYNEIKAVLHERISRNSECVEQKADGVSLRDQLESLERLYGVNNPEHYLYFYHSDHLGSSSFITDADGIATQHLQYLPFGEQFIEQRYDAPYFTPYKFSAKEKDEETQYSYFGARYYDADLSIWLSVDPMAHLRESLTPYNYCSNNPIMRTDPTGALDGDYYDADGVYLGNDGIDDNKVYQLKDNYRAKFENTNVNWGGTLEEKHYNELKSKSNDLGTVQDAFVTGDAISDKRIQSLHPAIRMLATDFIKEANANSSGTLIRIAQGYRTYAEQDALYAQGRTAPGKIVTNAKGGYSNHNFGLAFDIVGITDGKVDYNLDWNSLSKLGKSKGFEWGGDWKKLPDKPHFENMFGNSLINLRALPKDKNGLPILKP